MEFQRKEVGCRGWVRLDWIGLSCIGLDCVGPHRDSFSEYIESEMKLDYS